MKKNIFQLQKISLAFIFSVLSFCSVFAQAQTTKIKDGTISSTPEKAKQGSIFELESNNKGMLTPRLSKSQRDAIPGSNLSNGLLVYNTNTNCFDYWDAARAQWLSLCGTPPPAVFTTNCSKVRVNGEYIQGTNMTSANTISIPLTITASGTYTITATSGNGYYFEDTGTFPAGQDSVVLTLPAKGDKPEKGYPTGDPGDVITIALNGVVSCTVNNYVRQASVDFSITCSSIVAQGNYFIGTPLLQDSNILKVDIDVTSPGSVVMQTNTVNGYSFKGAADFASAGPQTVYLQGTGSPITSGTDIFSVSSNGLSKSTCSGVQVIVAPVAYTIDCSRIQQSGSYLQDVALNNSNKITLPISVTAPGTTTVTATGSNGISFSSGLVTIDKTTTSITLTATAGTPTAGGALSLSVSGTPGASTTCSANLNIAGQPVVYSMNCSNINVAGNYVPNNPMVDSNTMTIPVTVTYPGNYDISATANGVTFSGRGTLTKGTTSVVLTASGTPISGGLYTFTINSNSTSGNKVCSKDITFVYRIMNIVGIGSSDYQPGGAKATQSPRAILKSTANFGPSGTVKIQSMNIVDGGSNPSASTIKNLINTNKADIIYIGNFTPDANETAVLVDFVKNKGGVVIYADQASGGKTLINSVFGSNVTLADGTGSLYNASNIADPVLVAPFGDVRGKLFGRDGGSDLLITTSTVPSNSITLGTQGNNTFAIKHNSLGFIYLGDAGFAIGTATDTYKNDWPAKMTTLGLPVSKPYNGGNVDNSTLYANIFAWAIQYAQENRILGDAGVIK